MDRTDLEKFMRLAMEESRNAIALCGDNPPVGCVLVRDGVVVAKGHTNAPGEAHAEAMAIGQLNENGDLAAFVTLEPCSFHGRTPSCAMALVEAGVETVYVGMLDPDYRNNGRGIDLMRSAGIAVRVGLLEREIAAELKDYLGKAL